MGVGREIERSNRAIFFDRDGVLNHAVVRNGRPHPPESSEHLEIVAGAKEILERLKRRGFWLVAVTNQPDVARGTQTRAAVDAINAALARALPLDDVFACFHDDADGCDCRKPAPGLLLHAARRYALDLQASFLVGDRWRDVEAGRRAGVRTVFIDYQYDERRPEPAADATVTGLAEAAAWIEANA